MIISQLSENQHDNLYDIDTKIDIEALRRDAYAKCRADINAGNLTDRDKEILKQAYQEASYALFWNRAKDAMDAIIRNEGTECDHELMIIARQICQADIAAGKISDNDKAFLKIAAKRRPSFYVLCATLASRALTRDVPKRQVSKIGEKFWNKHFNHKISQIIIPEEIADDFEAAMAYQEAILRKIEFLRRIDYRPLKLRYIQHKSDRTLCCLMKRGKRERKTARSKRKAVSGGSCKDPPDQPPQKPP